LTQFLNRVKSTPKVAEEKIVISSRTSNIVIEKILFCTKIAPKIPEIPNFFRDSEREVVVSIGKFQEIWKIFGVRQLK
jgi:hypothetical protein